MKTCPICARRFDPTKDAYVTFYERKGSPVDLCSARCALEWEQS